MLKAPPFSSYWRGMGNFGGKDEIVRRKKERKKKKKQENTESQNLREVPQREVF